MKLSDDSFVHRAGHGQVALEMALVVGFIFGLGLATLQFGGLAMTAWKVGHAAQMAAYAAGSEPATSFDPQARDARTPCWAVNGGLKYPGGYADADVCQAVVANLGDLDPQGALVTVQRQQLSQPQHELAIHVTVIYKERITSPLVRWIFGPTFTTTSEATSWY